MKLINSLAGGILATSLFASCSENTVNAPDSQERSISSDHDMQGVVFGGDQQYSLENNAGKDTSAQDIPSSPKYTQQQIDDSLPAWARDVTAAQDSRQFHIYKPENEIPVFSYPGMKEGYKLWAAQDLTSSEVYLQIGDNLWEQASGTVQRNVLTSHNIFLPTKKGTHTLEALCKTGDQIFEDTKTFSVIPVN